MPRPIFTTIFEPPLPRPWRPEAFGEIRIGYDRPRDGRPTYRLIVARDDILIDHAEQADAATIRRKLERFLR